MTGADLYIKGLGCALINLRHCPQYLMAQNWRGIKRIAKNLISPCDMWRYIEFPFVLSHIETRKDKLLNILDVGSPKFLSLYIAQKYNCNIIATDIVANVIEEVNWYKKAASRENLKGQIEDGTNLSFEDKTFSLIYSVSCVEHIGNDGDIRAIKEMARCLAPGGKLIITVPFVVEFREFWTDKDLMGCQIHSPEGKAFFSRYYDRSSLWSRLIQPSRLKLLEIRAWQETIPGWYKNKYLARTEKAYVGRFVKVLDYYFSKTKIQPIDPCGLTNHGLAGIVLEKH